MATSVTSDAEVLERTRAIVPLLRENAQRAERERRIPFENVQALLDAGVLRMTTPRIFGGYESSCELQCRVLAEVARGCPSTGWVATIYMAMIWNVALFPDEAQDEVFATEDLRVASVFAPGGVAKPADGGVMVSGRWPFNTGCDHAQWAIMTALRELPGGGMEPISVLIPYAELTILDDWHATGLAGTGSHTTVGEDVFVPAHRILPGAALATGEYLSQRLRDVPLYRTPGVPYLVANAGGAPVGIAQGALDAFRERLPGRRITYTDYESQAAAPVTHIELARAAMLADTAEDHMLRAARLLDEGLTSPLDLEQRARIRAHVGFATDAAREATSILFRSSGASAIQEDVPIQRYHRDIEALANHALMAPLTNLELYGRILCGLEPNTPFV
ncbi:MAG TPA: acyl-CoA dehydrogenase family protein [Capillimicrobium sp.]|nr:acyl-CoA dehydrogenase family protein [Capillimicrobium sp.]